MGTADIVELLRRERGALLGCLSGLEPADWQRRTPCPDWRVHDLVAHLWGAELAFLARFRDGWAPGLPDAGDDLTAAIDAHNARWVAACRVVSPAQLLAGLRASGAETAVYLGHTDLSAPGETIRWIGTDVMPLGMCAARELTERFIHHDQLRRALDQPTYEDPDVVGAVVDAMIHAAPARLASAPASEGAVVQIAVGGAVRRRWRFVFDGQRWQPSADAEATPAASMRADALDLVRLWSGGLSPGEQVTRIDLTGEPRLYAALRDTRAAHVTT